MAAENPKNLINRMLDHNTHVKQGLKTLYHIETLVPMRLRPVITLLITATDYIESNLRQMISQVRES